MSLLTDLLESESVQKILADGELFAFEQFLDLLEKIVSRTETPEDNEALALFLDTAAKRVREKTPA